MIAYLMIVDQFMYSKSDLDGKRCSHQGGVGSPSVGLGNGKPTALHFMAWVAALLQGSMDRSVPKV